MKVIQFAVTSAARTERADYYPMMYILTDDGRIFSQCSNDGIAADCWDEVALPVEAPKVDDAPRV